MRIKAIVSIILSLLALSPSVLAKDPNYVYTEQERRLDSLKAVAHNAKNDTTLCYAYILIGEEVYLSDPDTAMILFQAARELAEAGLALDLPPTFRERYMFLMSEALNDIGYILESRGNIEQALEYNHKSLKMSQQLMNSDNEAVARDGKYAVATSLNNMGIMYDNQGDYTKGLEYHQRSLKMREELGDKYRISESLHNIGYIYDVWEDLEKAMDYYRKSLAISEEIDAKIAAALSLNAIGSVYILWGEEEKALEYFERGLKLNQEMGDKGGVALLLNNTAAIYLHQGDVARAKEYALRSMAIGQELGYPERIGNAANRLSQVYSAEKDYKQALEMYELYIRMQDSVKNKETQKAAIRQQTKYEFEKAQLVKEQEENEVARLEAEILGRRDNLQYSVVLICLLGIGILIAFLGKLSLSERAAEGLIFFAFLIFFEFILVLADPYVDKWTGGAPGLKLLINASIAALIFPLHSFFETKLKHRLAR